MIFFFNFFFLERQSNCRVDKKKNKKQKKKKTGSVGLVETQVFL